MTPAELDRHVCEAADAAVQRHGFSGCQTYVAKTGRLRLIEVHYIVRETFPVGLVATLDAIREEVGREIGGEGRNRWLTIAFTGDEKWAA